jgi:hypothetical protein
VAEGDVDVVRPSWRAWVMVGWGSVERERDHIYTMGGTMNNKTIRVRTIVQGYLPKIWVNMMIMDMILYLYYTIMMFL